MTLRDGLLLGQIVTMRRAQAARAWVHDRAERLLRDERGQTPTEYLMIVGLMAAVIVLVFVTFYWGQVKTAANSWVVKVKDSILGSSITP